MKPKYLKKKKIPGWIWVLILAILLIAGVVAAFVLTDAGQEPAEQPSSGPQASEEPSSNPDETQDTSVPEESTEAPKDPPVLVEFENGRIQTPYLTLYYPESFEDCLLVTNSCQSPYTLEFYAVLPERTEQRLFDLSLGAGADGNLGTVTTEAGQIPVSATVYSFTPDSTWEQGQIDTVLAMQEAFNELIGKLGIVSEAGGNDAPAVKEEPGESAPVYFIQVETPYCTLYYPAPLADRLSVSQVGSEDVHRVEFYCNLEDHEPLLMFCVLFGGDEGEQLGVVTNADGITVPVNILMNTPDEDALQPEQLEILYAMQEAVNQLIEYLPLQ